MKKDVPDLLDPVTMPNELRRGVRVALPPVASKDARVEHLLHVADTRPANTFEPGPSIPKGDAAGVYSASARRFRHA